MNKKKCIKLSVLGFVLGIVLCSAITAVTSSIGSGSVQLCNPAFAKVVGNETAALILQTLISGIYGAIVMGASIVYDIEPDDVKKWSILKATVTHCVITFTSYYITGFVLRWFSFKDVKENLIMLIIFISVYTLIWLINYLSYKKEIKSFNEKLRELDEDNVSNKTFTKQK